MGVEGLLLHVISGNQWTSNFPPDINYCLDWMVAHPCHLEKRKKKKMNMSLDNFPPWLTSQQLRGFGYHFHFIDRETEEQNGHMLATGWLLSDTGI